MDDKKEDSSQEVPPGEINKYVPKDIVAAKKFLYGVGLSVIAWLVSSLIISLFWGSVDRMGFICIISLIIWVPFANFAGLISRDEEGKSAMKFVIGSFFTVFLVVGGCLGMLR